MASNSIPKLKVYRLDESKTNVDSKDNDAQPMSDDEMIPVIKKDLNPFNTEEMVGVSSRQDSRLVCESNSSYAMFIPVSTGTNQHLESEDSFLCEGWILGKGNIHVYVHRQLSVQSNESENESHSTVSAYNPVTGSYETASIVNLGDSESSSADGVWVELDRRFWDYSVSSTKTYYSPSTGYVFVNPETEGCEVHEMDWISFRVGNILIHGNRFFVNGYDNYIPIEGEGSQNRILIVYKKYCELGGYLTNAQASAFSDYSSIINATGVAGSINGSSSKYRVPFGNVYNGNREGRSLHAGTGTDMKIVNLIEGEDVLNSNEMNYYEGNYLYRRKVYPLRMRVLHERNAVISSEYVCDSVHNVPGSSNYIIDNGSTTVPCELSWFMDDIMKPVVFERITVDIGTNDERKIFKKLAKSQVSVQYQSTNGDHYAVTLTPRYYSSSSSHLYPKELFFVYNYVDDSLGNIFDFNYHYGSSEFISATSSLGYGYANNGIIRSDNPAGSTIVTHPIAGNGLNAFVMRDIIASSENSAMHDSTRDVSLTNSGTVITFSIPKTQEGIASAFTIDEHDTEAEKAEKKRILDGLAYFAPSHGMRLYYEGKVVWDCDGTVFTGTCQIGGNECTVSYTDSATEGTFRIEKTGASQSAIDFAGIMEFMLVYYESRGIGFEKVNIGTAESPSYVNPCFIGYRIPCHEKVKSSTLFVSSFTSWVKGHVNNDLDVFYGNKLYSGTEITDGGLSDYHDIYPEYVKDGWYAMYSDGAIEFNEEKTEQNYFDVLNYSQFNSGEVTGEEWNFASTWNAYVQDGYTGLMPNYWREAKKRALLYKKVRYNVAHYDGIYAVTRCRMSNFSNKNGVYKYALIEDDDFTASANKRWLIREDDNLKRMHECAREELPVVASTNGMETPDVLTDIDVADGSLVVPNTADDRVCVFSIHGNSHSVFFVDSNPSSERLAEISELTASHVRIHVKATGANDSPANCLAIGLEQNQGALPFPTQEEEREAFLDALFDEDEAPVNWIYLPDNDDAYVGKVSDDKQTYNGVGIELVQTGEITIDATSGQYWFNDGERIPIPADGIVPFRMEGTIPVDGMLRRYRYHKLNDSTWCYDVFFEVFSYRYSVTDERPYEGAGKNPVSYVEMVVYRETAE